MDCMNKKIGLIVTITFLVIQFATAQYNTRKATATSQPFKESILNQLAKEKEAVQAHLDSVITASDRDIAFSDSDVLISRRIQRLYTTIPLEYNDRVKAYLDKYVSRNYKPYMEKLLGLSQFYFPIYEKIFNETGIPDEVKYLSVVESSLNPHTVSTSGAVGPWQFIYGTAKIYDLSMDGFMDERKDVFSTTYAVSRYLTEAYREFDDWLLALASYNCGRGCVRRAIQRSGMTNPTFWELSPYLPKETQNYIPKYIAMTYTLTHAELHGLVPRPQELQGEYRVVMVDKHIDLNNVACAIGTPVDILKEFNPAYKRNIVNGTPVAPRRLIIPYHDEVQDSLLYIALNNQTIPQGLIPSGKETKVNPEKIDRQLASNVAKAKKVTTQPKYIVHTVKKGDTLSGIANKYKGATIAKLRADNSIKGSHLKIGAKIKVFQGEG